MSRLRAHLLGLLLIAFGLALLLPTIDVEHLNLYDDGVYASAAQAMREHGRYLFTVDDAGNYAVRGLSKPPLFLWTIILSLKTFGNGLLALRFPSVLATVLTAYVAYWYALRSAPDSRFGSALGFLAALLALLNAGATDYGQAVCIEPVFTLFLWLALFCYAEAMSAARYAMRFAALSGLCMALAFLTKQAAAGVVVAPIVVAELVLGRRAPRRAIARLSVAAVPAIVISGTWLFLAYKAVGNRLLWQFFVYSVAYRLQGFRSNYHYSWLNRVAGELDKTFAPFPWELGLVGVALLAAVGAHALREQAVASRGPADTGGATSAPDRRAQREDRSLAALLVPHPERAAFFILPFLYAVAWVFVYENASRSLLAWYTVGLAFPNALGLAFMLAAPFAIFEIHWSEAEVAAPPRRVAAALFGATAMGFLLVLSRWATNYASRPNVVVVCALIAFCALAYGDRFRFVGRFMVSEARRAVPGFVALAALILAVRVRPEPDALDVLARTAAKRGLKRIWSESIYPPSPNPKTILFAFFAPAKVLTGAPPWEDHANSAELAMFGTALPNEIGVTPGVEVVRLSGIHAFFGQLDKAPYAADAFDKALEAGPLTLESEYMETDFRQSVIEDSRASGGRARAYRPMSDLRATPLVLGSATVRLGPGQYVARFRIAYMCRGFAGEEILADLMERESTNLPVREALRERTSLQVTCARGAHGMDYHYVDLPFELKQGPMATVQVIYHRGQLLFDVVEIWRKATFESRVKSAT